MNNLITTALPYANGDLHWGHFYEAIIADIYAKHKGCPLISGDDQHGAAITIYAEKHKLDLKEHLKSQYQSHLEQYQKLGIKFDFYGQTSSIFQKKLVLYFYEKLKAKNLIFYRDTISWFDQQAGKFLPYRYVRGNCPHCGKGNVYPHICEHCNAHFNAEELVNPISVDSGNTPELKTTEHLFLNTEAFFQHLDGFCTKLQVHDSIRKKILDNALSHLKEIDISRDLPYFGIQVPDRDLAFYVWFDAPLGYLSFILEKISQENPSLSFEELIAILPTLKLEHVIGKDIVYFHTFFWLNLLQILDLPLPERLHVHGWIVQDNGEKFSKSNGDKLNLLDFQDNQIDAIRLYFASIYDGSILDNNFSLEGCWDFYNHLVVGKFVNIYSRISKILEKNSIKTVILQEKSHYHYEESLVKSLDDFHLKNAIKTLAEWCDVINQYIETNQPWKKESVELIEIGSHVLTEFRLIGKHIGSICPYLSVMLNSLDYHDIHHIHLAKKL